MSKNRLGKGLGALINDAAFEEDSSTSGRLREIYVQQIEPNPFQPRQEFDQEELKELADSIKENGIIQPITVRQIKPDLYQLVTGERRWRASRMIGLSKIPAIIKDYDDRQMMETALIENIQREDLNPIEEAQAYQRMMEEFGLTQEDVASKVGKSRSSIANIVRLLNLSPKVQVYVSRETLSMGHARALLAIKNPEEQIQVADYIIKNNLSVRETEKFVHSFNKEMEKKKEKAVTQNKKTVLGPEWIKAQEELSRLLGTKVKIKNNNNNKKVITIECDNYSDVKKLINTLSLG
ncbi:MAG TPA: ParB/RepB/Spo0J family partition protein [Halanaerobiales bacterium]|nr:ParB/RepB/Spo0J family partition protein [Halanaerobiales bacterium]HPZ62991.1 ParB/RepB/Spo0J family partition protein [Halanaerobiales bacterium]HQD04200.1 ParB/RepB/Spo0J family partition protein [Halanaerobiales bacterium]